MSEFSALPNTGESVTLLREAVVTHLFGSLNIFALIPKIVRFSNKCLLKTLRLKFRRKYVL